MSAYRLAFLVLVLVGLLLMVAHKMSQRRTLTAAAAAALVGLPLDELLELAGQGQVPMSTLGMRGWLFSREGLTQLADRLALSGPDDDDGEAA